MSYHANLSDFHACVFVTYQVKISIILSPRLTQNVESCVFDLGRFKKYLLPAIASFCQISNY